MGKVALMATRASELALIDAGLVDDPLLKSGRLGNRLWLVGGHTESDLRFWTDDRPEKHPGNQRDRLISR